MGLWGGNSFTVVDNKLYIFGDSYNYLYVVCKYVNMQSVLATFLSSVAKVNFNLVLHN